jgi:regulator of sigma E protease
MGFVAVLVGILTLSVLILVHEFGHYVFAKIFGVWVEEFGIGFPPRLWGKKLGETIYSINWIPFGGFNKLSGEVDPAAPRSLAGRSYLVRLLVMGGGILFNLLFPFILLAAAYMVPHTMVQGQVQVLEVSANSPAALAGIVPGDTILAADGQPINHSGDLSRAVQIHLGANMTFLVRHADGTEVTLTAAPRWRPPAGEGNLGVSTNTTDITVYRESLPFWKAIPTGATSLWETLVLYKNGIAGMIMGTVPFVPAGPVGIVQVTGEAVSAGISPLLELAAFISIAIAITQIIPFPALDGGRIFFVFLEWVRGGKRVSPRTEGIVHSIGFVILLGLLVLITYQDIARWISGGSLVP